MRGARPTGKRTAPRPWLAAAVIAVGVLAAAPPAAARRARVVVFPFLAKTTAHRIYAQSLAQAVAKAVDGPLLEAQVAAERPPAEDLAAATTAARGHRAHLAVLAEIAPASDEEVVLRARLLEVARGALTGTVVETRAPLERLDEGAAVVGAALRAQAEAWLARQPAATQPRRSAVLVYGVDAPVGRDGVDVRVAATKSAYRVVSRYLHHRPLPCPTYGLVSARAAATAAATAGAVAAVMLRIEQLSFTAGRTPTAIARVTFRAVSADARLVRERTLAVTVARGLAEARQVVAARVVAECLGRVTPDLRDVLAQRRNP